VEYQKVKSVAKQVTPKGAALTKIVLNTTKTIADVVGATLGPGGAQVLIERFEHDMPPIVTKDGVTVFKALGFTDAAQHVIMEAMRDVAIRTAVEAGDGTTTATILAEAISRFINQYCKANPTARAQKVVRRLERVLEETIMPAIAKASIKADPSTKEGKDLLLSVAKVSANGDQELAKAVLECFELVGDEGNVTIVEASGASRYEVEKIDGYPIPMGYDYSCGRFAPMYINDPGRQLTVLDKPVFVLYHGPVHDTMTAFALLDKVGAAYEALLRGEQTEYRHHSVVFVATSFSEHVLAAFGAGFQAAVAAIKVFPLTIPKSPFPNYQTEFLEDLSAITGATVFDPVTKSMDLGTLEDLGPGVESFEASRIRSNIIGRATGEPWDTRCLDRVDIVTTQLQNPESIMDGKMLQERLAKLTGGIAKLRIYGSSNAELREKKDRADDAVCAVRGAIQHGCLPGGGWMLLKIIRELALAYPNEAVIQDILKPALMEPVMRLLFNCGMSEDEAVKTLDPILIGIRDNVPVIYDAMEDRHGDPIKLGVLDSTPAVAQAIRNSLSMASLIGTLGGIVVIARDNAFERQEARDVQDWMRNANTNEADDRP
jgi:chaperonin GroEL